MKAILSGLSALLALVLLSLGSQSQPPNFVFIYADDQGWTGLSTPMIPGRPETKSNFFRTPNIDRLAAEGMVFSQAYSPAPKCEPSRYSMTFGMTTTSLNAPDKRVTQLNARLEDSLANTLKRARPDYATAVFGKWQLFRDPSELGFDAHDGITQNADGESDDPRDPKRMFSLTGRGNAFMEKQVKAGRPFYLQLWHYAVHQSVQALPETLAKWQTEAPGRRDAGMAAMTADFDACVGLTLAKIDELGIRDNTWVIYMSDNGGRTRLLRGGKNDLTEGGLRVPLIVRGPGVRRGSYCNVPVIGYDLFPTVLDIAAPGVRLPRGLEGGSWKPLLLNGGAGEVKRPIDRFVFYWAQPRGAITEPHAAVRAGKYKLIHYWKRDEAELFDVSSDLREQNNLAARMPDLAARLQKQLKDHVRAGLGQERYTRILRGEFPQDRRPDRSSNRRRRRDAR